MRVSVIVILILSLATGTALAQAGGHIGLYSDQPGYSDCNLHETLYVTNVIYVVHTLAMKGNSSQFKIINTWTGPLVGPVNWGSNLTLGDPYTGITITYVGCKNLPYLLGTLSFIPLSPTPPCVAWMWVVADPAVSSGEIEAVDCNYVLLAASGGSLSINGAIDCEWLCGHPYGGPLSAESTSWGKVKALYQ